MALPCKTTKHLIRDDGCNVTISSCPSCKLAIYQYIMDAACVYFKFVHKFSINKVHLHLCFSDVTFLFAGLAKLLAGSDSIVPINQVNEVMFLINCKLL